MLRTLTAAVPIALAMGCAAHHGSAPSAIASAGSDLADAPVPGAPFAASLVSIDGEAITVPDPGARVVVLELIRSADW